MSREPSGQRGRAANPHQWALRLPFLMGRNYSSTSKGLNTTITRSLSELLFQRFGAYLVCMVSLSGSLSSWCIQALSSRGPTWNTFVWNITTTTASIHRHFWKLWHGSTFVATSTSGGAQMFLIVYKTLYKNWGSGHSVKNICSCRCKCDTLISPFFFQYP